MRQTEIYFLKADELLQLEISSMFTAQPSMKTNSDTRKASHKRSLLKELVVHSCTLSMHGNGKLSGWKKCGILIF